MKVGLPVELLYLDWGKRLKTYMETSDSSLKLVHLPEHGSKGANFTLSEGDACFPFKKMVRNAIALLPEVDILLVPRLVKLDGYLLCPNFRALPDIVALNRDRLPGNLSGKPLVDTVVEVNDDADEQRIFARIIQELTGAGPGKKTRDQQGARPQEQQMKQPPVCDEKTIVIIGRPYVLRDPHHNMGIPELIKSRGYKVLTTQDLPFAELDILAAEHDYYAKTLYWRGARECLGSFMYYTEHCRPAGIIFILAFNCGVDALMRLELMSLHKKLEPQIPFMVLVGDEHTQKEHIVTRLEAFLDVIDGITCN